MSLKIPQNLHNLYKKKKDSLTFFCCSLIQGDVADLLPFLYIKHLTATQLQHFLNNLSVALDAKTGAVSTS